MADWTDQLDLPGPLLNRWKLYLGDALSAEIEAYEYDSSTRYRLSVGSLFGSQSLHFRSLEDVLTALVSVNKVKGTNKKINIKTLTGLLSMEPRKDDDETLSN